MGIIKRTVLKAPGTIAYAPLKKNMKGKRFCNKFRKKILVLYYIRLHKLFHSETILMSTILKIRTVKLIWILYSYFFYPH